ncbi:hypothetical protein F444_08877 [Phytophthora nicotianae P1976]|uniref:PiggyBac transposable element-derived protein domain-containing protein n=1 Tax=Phytophthora nicotianae P1976 TaxID=1317066 RepID=A0A081A9L1_PHYNI|nr:hypothetical protein F444_08877 [Phytophthora nicotianae P1976]
MRYVESCSLIRFDPEDINVGYGSARDVRSELGTEEELDVPAEPGSVYESEVDSDSDFDDDSSAFLQDDTDMRQLTATGWDIYDEHHSGDVVLDAAELYDGSFGPTRPAAAFAESPLGIFFYFLPKKMRFAIAKESNAYREECIPAVAKAQRGKQLQAQRRDPLKSVQPLEVLEEKMRKDGAVPRGTFSRYMKRERFRLVTRYLHFTKNDPAAAATDKAWKVRPILQVLEKTFRRGYRLGPRISFDEGTISNRSKFNPVRVYNEKPHKCGTKVYMTCCAETGYCTRMEVYHGAVENSKGVKQKAVIRNVTKALDGQAHKRLIIADNFYTSCALLLELLDKDLYYVGTHRNERLGPPKPFAFTQKKRPKTMPRGLYRIAHTRDYPGLVTLSWMDSKPVALLATGCSTVPTTVMRRAKGETERVAVPCPQLVVDYHQGMSGVDRHDQLRLQRYSIQLTVAFIKYYRQLFMSFVDMAIVNGFILLKIILKQKGQPVPTHAQYMRRLHTELLATNEATLRANTNAEDLVSEPIHTQPHRLRNNEEKYKGKKRRKTRDGSTASNLQRKGKKRKGKRRQHLCKVCSALATPQTKSFETSYYCEQCTPNFGGYVPLCNKVRHEETGNTLTFGQIWHELWRNGTAIPAHLKKRIRIRKRKHFEVSSDSDDGGSDANEDCVDSQDSE